MLRGEAARLLPPPHPRASGSRRGPGPQRTLPRVRWVSQPRPPRGRLCVRRHPARDTSGCPPATGVGPSPPPPRRPPSRAQAGLVLTATWTQPRDAPREPQPRWGQGHGHAPRRGRGRASSRPRPAASPLPPAPGRGAGAGASPDPPGPAETTRGLPPASQGRVVRADQGGTRATAAPAPP